MKIIKTGQPIFPIPLPRDLVLHKRIAGLPGAAGHRMWVAQNQELVLADAKRGVGAFLAEQKLPVHSTVCIVPTFFLKPHQLPGGYNVDAVSQFSDKGSRLALPKEIQIAASKDPALLRQMAVVQLVPGFSHFRVSTDQAGNAKKITPVFARPAAPGKIFVAREREQIHPPGFLPGLLLYRPGIVEGALNTMGFEEVEVPFLGVPLRIRQYIGQVVAVHRLLGEIFTGKFGKGFSDVFARGGGSGFYKWWLRGFGGGSFTLENLPLYAKSRWIGSELDTDSMNADAGSMAFYLAHMARLATEVMPDFVDTRMTIGSIPIRWQDVEAYLLR